VSDALREVAQLVHRETGVVVKDAQLPALAAAIERVAPGMDAKRLLAQVSATVRGSLLHRLVDEVTVQETFFFRELRELEAIDWRALLAGARESASGGVRVWVAACATGEEAYSLAILASEALGYEVGAVTILATDISHAALERAGSGAHYSERSVRNLSQPLRDRYLLREKDHYRVREGIKSLVRFRYHNLIADPSPPLGEVPFDVIACRNVLIYFDPPTVERVLGALEGSLRPEGQLILGAADRLTGTAGALAGLGARPETERRHKRRRSKRSLRRPLGLPPAEGEEPPERPAAASLQAGDREPPAPRRRAEDRIEDALLAADAGDLAAALGIVEALLGEDPLVADAYFVRGLVELEEGDAGAAASSLRRSLYLDPTFGLAAFELGRAHDAKEDHKAARRAYEQALRTLDPEDERHRAILDQVDLGDVAAACTARLRAERGAAR
jgi:chemotaxis methyl-accepting protein methylase